MHVLEWVEGQNLLGTHPCWFFYSTAPTLLHFQHWLYCSLEQNPSYSQKLFISWMLALWSSFDVHLSLLGFWFNAASLTVRELLWAGEVSSSFVLSWAWQSLCLFLSDNILFDLKLLHIFELWSDDPSPLSKGLLCCCYNHRKWDSCGLRYCVYHSLFICTCKLPRLMT